jgi:hypothetical protein
MNAFYLIKPSLPWGSKVPSLSPQTLGGRVDSADLEKRHFVSSLNLIFTSNCQKSI